MTTRNSRSRKPRVLKAQVGDDGVAEVIDTGAPGKEVAVFVSNDEAKAAAEDIAKGKKPAREFVFTPYQAHYLVNALLAEAEVVDEYGVVKTIGSPMMYIYAGKDKFVVTIANDGTGRKQVDFESFMLWAEGYVERAKKLQDARNKKARKKAVA